MIAVYGITVNKLTETPVPNSYVIVCMLLEILCTRCLVVALRTFYLLKLFANKFENVLSLQTLA